MSRKIYAAFTNEELAKMASILQSLCDSYTYMWIEEADRLLDSKPGCEYTLHWHAGYVEQLKTRLGRFAPYSGIRKDFLLATGLRGPFGHEVFDYVAEQLS